MTEDTKSPTIEAIELRAALDKRDREIAKLQADLAKAGEQIGQFRRARLESTIGEACKKMGVFEKAIPEIIGYADKAGEWDIDPKGRFRRKDEGGFFDEDAYEWLRRFKDASPFYFQDYHLTEGLSGKTVNAESESARVKVGDESYTKDDLRAIFDPKKMNLTKASLIYRENPELAATVAQEVGNKIFARIEEQDRRFGR